MSLIALGIFFFLMFLIIRRLLRAKKRGNRASDLDNRIEDAVASNAADAMQEVLDELESKED